MKRIFRFFREYKLFSVALLASAVALGLDIFTKSSSPNWILSIMSAIVVITMLRSMWDDIRTGTYGVDILAVTAIVTSLVLGEFWVAAVIVLMFTGGEALEVYAGRRAKTELSALLKQAPRKAHLIRKNGTVDEIAASKVAVGDTLLIKPGEIIPVDAVVLEGTAQVDESSLTGESIPQAKQVNDNLLSGSIAVDGSLTVKALHTAKDSQYEQIIKLVKSASTAQSPFVRLADRYAIPFTLVAFAIAGGAWIASGDSTRFLQVLVVATPCPLILAAPIAIISGMSRAAKHGIIIKTGSALEKLAEVKTIAFDKTGTLTKGELAIDTIKTYNSFSKTDVLAAAATLEQSSNHVVSRAILEAAAEQAIKLGKVKHVTEISGRGLTGTINGKYIVVGRLALLEEQGVTIPKLPAGHKHQTSVYVAINETFAGVISMTDTLRPESKETIDRLHKLGVQHIMMVTGDNRTTAQAFAKQLGIDDVRAEALPGEKLIAVESAPNKPVAFVGDGVNDAPVLTISDVGIAMGARGSTIASESADMVIMLNDVSRVATVTQIAKHTFKIARQSIFIGIGLSIILMIVFATGRFPAIYGAAIQELIDVIVIFNALRAHGSFAKRTPQLKLAQQV